MSITKSLRVPSDLDREIRKELKRSGIQEWSAGVIELITEALRMRRAPGIVFVDSPSGRRAVVGGTGIDVWEIVATWQSAGKDFQALRAAYDWLTEAQLRAALGFYELYPREIVDRIAREAEWTPERVAAELPFTIRRPG
jgi:uncharacterized protein (DUF433 family)